MEGLPSKPGRPQFEHLGAYRGPCLIPGRLQDFGPYPRLAPGRGPVHGELWFPSTTSNSDLAANLLDAWEMADPNDLGSAACRRIKVRLLEPSLTAWVYVYSYIPKLTRIRGGNWKELSKAYDMEGLLRLSTERPTAAKMDSRPNTTDWSSPL